MMGAAFGLGFLAKGPVMLVMAGPMLLYLLFRKEFSDFLFTPWTLLALMLSLYIGLFWYLQVIKSVPNALTYFLDNQIWGRLVSAKYSRNSDWYGPFVIYLPTFTLGALPWSISWPFLFRRIQLSLSIKHWWSELLHRPRGLLLLLWVAVPLVIFSLASSRLPLYILPLFPPLCLITAKAMILYAPEYDLFSFNINRNTNLLLVTWIVFLICFKLEVAYWPTEKDSRFIWRIIQRQVEDIESNKYEIVIVNKKFNGLGFYSKGNVESVTTRKNPYHFFKKTESLKEEIDELTTTQYNHIFLVHSRDLREKRESLLDACIPYRDLYAPHNYHLFICKLQESKREIIRLAAIGDAGTGKQPQRMVANAIYHTDQRYSLDGIILLGDNVVGWNGKGDPEVAYKAYFERPNEALITNGVPFYATLGNHDLIAGSSTFQTHYPLFNMRGKRYYSRTFGNNLVEVFFIDSNTLQNDPKQIAWMETALSESCTIWKVVATHHPIYSTGAKHPASALIARRLEPLFVKNRVNIVVSAHNHLYERLHPVKDVHYFNVGSGGIVQPDKLIPGAQARAAGNDEENIFLLLEFRRNECRFTAFTGEEKVADEGWIRRGGD